MNKIIKGLVTIYFFIRKTLKKTKPYVTIDTLKSKITIIYRISDKGYPKEKPWYINNKQCLSNAVKRFPLSECNWYLIADNVCEKTFQMIKEFIPENLVRRVSIGHGAGTFRIGYEYALSLPSDTIVYFLENDYIHRKGSLNAIKEGIQINKSEYVTLYDHPVQYGYNEEDSMITNRAKKTKVFLSKGCHWKFIDATTMTFAAQVSTLRKDKHIFWRWTNKTHACDEPIFFELGLKGKKLISPLPSLSTHGDTKCLALLIDWEKEAIE